MPALARFVGFLLILHLAAGKTENPTLTPCPGYPMSASVAEIITPNNPRSSREHPTMQALRRGEGVLATAKAGTKSLWSVEDAPVEILDVTVSNAKLGSKIKFDAIVSVKATVGEDPVLQLLFSNSDGVELPCVDEVVPCNLMLCDGTTPIEKRMNKDWDNTCPVQAGTYTTELEFRLPKNKETKEYFGDGNVEVTVKILDNGEILGCTQYPLKIDVD